MTIESMSLTPEDALARLSEVRSWLTGIELQMLDLLAKQAGERLKTQGEWSFRECVQVGSAVETILWSNSDSEFPDFCRTEYFQDIMKRIHSESAAGIPAATMLKSFLWNFHATMRAGEDPRYLRDSLHEIGKFLSRMFTDGEAQVVEMQKWAKAFNAISDGKYSVQVPIIGMQVDPGWMSARPGVRNVTNIHGWTVRDSKGGASRSAEVS